MFPSLVILLVLELKKIGLVGVTDANHAVSKF